MTLYKNQAGKFVIRFDNGAFELIDTLTDDGLKALLKDVEQNRTLAYYPQTCIDLTKVIHKMLRHRRWNRILNTLRFWK